MALKKNGKMSFWILSGLRPSKMTVAIGSIALLLAACGGDSSSTKGPEPADDSANSSTSSSTEADSADIVKDSFEDLPVCTDKREGATAYVDDKTAYVCVDGDWVAASSDSRVRENDESSSSRQPPLDGESSSSSLDNVQDSEAIPTSLDGVNGFSQKGPFIKGSNVKVLELESGRTLKQTGRNFDTKIQTDDGHFKLNATTMVSQYIELHAEGYYRDEVSGKNSSSPLTLYALTDVTMREGGKVNINLLTHLEYQRVVHLVQKQKMKVYAAKNQAQKEILAILNIDSKGFGNSEDLNIVGATDANGALLAFSILFQGERSVADLTSMLQSVVSDLEDNGEWNDEATKAKIADWAQEKDLAGGLATIRSNIEKWDLGTVPNFEKYVRNFWYTNYGLGKCGSSNNSEVLATKNERSATYGTLTRYICKDGTWVEATDLEKDFYKSGKDNGDDGEIWTGLLTGKRYKYDEAQNKWLTATHNDTTLKLMGCTTNRTGRIEKSPTDDIYYVCKNMDWKTAQEVDYDTYGEKCTSEDVGKTTDGVVTATNKYYCTANGWVNLMDWNWDVPKEMRLNSAITYGTMTDTRDNKVYKTIKIGDQTWMAENLNYFDKTLDGRSWCFGASDSTTTANCAVTGRLYTWAAAIDSAKLYEDKSIDCGYGKYCTLPDTVYGICPPGWHLPKKYPEWEALFTEVGGRATAGKILKSQTGWNDYGDKNGNGTDAYGFSALPAGERSSIGNFIHEGEDASFWSASENIDITAFSVNLTYYSDVAYWNNGDKNRGFSVRCLQNSN